MQTLKVIFGIGALAALSACVNPEVVATNEVGDADLTCEQIEQQLVELQEIRKQADKGKSVSGENVVAALVFWPAVVGNNVNANKALDAARERHEVLVKLANEKNCSFAAG